MEVTRIPADEHAAHPWRIREIAGDFRLEDAWVLPVRGTRGQFAELLALFDRVDPRAASGPSRWLFALRDRLGRWLGWDDAPSDPWPIPGCRETTLRERLPADLPPAEVGDGGRMFAPVFATPTEWVAELSNATVHAAVQLGWVPDADGTWRGRLGVYTKPRGWLGRLYMAAIAPFRHFIVYPALIRSLGRAWDGRGGQG